MLAISTARHARKISGPRKSAKECVPYHVAYKFQIKNASKANEDKRIAVMDICPRRLRRTGRGGGNETRKLYCSALSFADNACALAAAEDAALESLANALATGERNFVSPRRAPGRVAIPSAFRAVWPSHRGPRRGPALRTCDSRHEEFYIGFFGGGSSV